MEDVTKQNTSVKEPEAEKKFSQTRKKTIELVKIFIEFFQTAIIVGLIAFVIRYFLVQPYVVEGASMEPNFHNNDYLLIEKVSDYFSEPNRGDVIVFRYPNNPKITYIKRIIGIPGDKITITGGQLKITPANNFQEKIISENYLPQSVKTSGNVEIILKDNEYFVLGDNRNNSSDSREWGILPKKDIIGRAWLVVLPFEDFGLVPRVDYNF